MAFYTKYGDLAEYRAALKRAVDDAMDNEIAYNAVLAMQDAIEDLVYDAYDPEFNVRRMEAGGLIAKANLVPTYIPGTGTLIIEAVAPWQNRGFRHIDGRGTYGGDLSDVIEHSQIYGAPARPFAMIAEDKYGRSKFAKDLKSALVRRGF